MRCGSDEYALLNSTIALTETYNKLTLASNSMFQK